VAGAVAGLELTKPTMPSSTFCLGAQQGWADALGLFDIFGVATRGPGHLVVARVAEIGEVRRKFFNGRDISAVFWRSAELNPLFFEKIPLLFL
jgi:hypothetical protein